MSDLIDNTGKPFVEAEYDEDGNMIRALREDGLWDVPLNLSDEEILILALEAHKQDITLNQLMVNVLLDEMSKLK